MFLVHSCQFHVQLLCTSVDLQWCLLCFPSSLNCFAEESQIAEKSYLCPGGWTEYNGRCFLYVHTSMTWANAERNCQKRGGNLASVHSFIEHHVIQGVILGSTHLYPLTWLGGFDATQEGTWFWSDGKPFTFNYWDQGQPDNHANAHCLVMNFG
ncbi:hypothetical protein L3Q82_016700, partial [Scortum barcoo]